MNINNSIAFHPSKNCGLSDITGCDTLDQTPSPLGAGARCQPTEVDSNASNLRLTVFPVVIYHHESESDQSYHSKGNHL